MKCLECGQPMRTRKANYPYRDSGLPGVILRGVNVSRCPNCGEEEVEIPRIEQLHRLMARLVIQKTTALSGPEVRFLRKYLGWSALDFARRMGSTRETVSRWENGKVAMSAQADRLLRLMVARERPIDDYSVDSFLNITSSKPSASRARPRRMGVTPVASGWAEAPA